MVCFLPLSLMRGGGKNMFILSLFILVNILVNDVFGQKSGTHSTPTPSPGSKDNLRSYQEFRNFFELSAVS